MPEVEKPASDSSKIGDFDRAATLRRDAARALPMSGRLAQMQLLCKQMTAIRGAARPR